MAYLFRRSLKVDHVDTSEVCQHLIIKSEVKVKLIKKVKLIVVGIVLGFILSSCQNSLLQADSSSNYLGQQGSTEWNPIYVKIVE